MDFIFAPILRVKAGVSITQGPRIKSRSRPPIEWEPILSVRRFAMCCYPIVSCALGKDFRDDGGRLQNRGLNASLFGTDVFEPMLRGRGNIPNPALHWAGKTYTWKQR